MIGSLISNMATGLVWIIIKISILVYRFIKYVWYGLLWPFMLIAMGISKIIINSRNVDVDKLREQSQKIYEKEKLKEEKNKDKVDLSSYKNENVDDNYFYVPITKYVSDDRDKIKIIIDELSSNYIYESNLISLLDKNIKLLNYEIVSDTMIIDFNNCIYLGDDKMLEEVIYSVFANYEVNKVIIKANGEEITKKTIKVIE